MSGDVLPEGLVDHLIDNGMTVVLACGHQRVYPRGLTKAERKALGCQSCAFSVPAATRAEKRRIAAEIEKWGAPR